MYFMNSLLRPKQFEQDLTWVRVGLAVRTAIDINLHRVALQRQARDELPSWRLRNILRTWLACYIVDRKLSAQLGKPASVRGENGIRLYMELLGRLKAKGQEGVDDVWVITMAVRLPLIALPLFSMVTRQRDSEAKAWTHACVNSQEWTLIMTRATDSFRNEAADFASDHARNFGLQTTALASKPCKITRRVVDKPRRVIPLALPWDNWRPLPRLALLKNKDSTFRRITSETRANLNLAGTRPSCLPACSCTRSMPGW
jgi:hypothetical protein